MYEYLEGQVAQRTATSVVLDVGGVGYELLAPLGSSFAARGARARVWTHLVVRADAHVLYGFAGREARELFRLLLVVRGVGPSMALAILSGLTPRDLVQAILDEDLVTLTRVKGVGKKTAQQILLDLQDRARKLAVGLEVAPGVIAPAAPPSPASDNIDDATTALMSIGYPAKEARKLVERAAEEVDPTDLERLVRSAIRS